MNTLYDLLPFTDHKGLLTAAALVVTTLGSLVAMFFLRPLWILRLYRALGLTKIETGPLLIVKTLTLLPWMVTHRRTLDAWVRSQRSAMSRAWNSVTLPGRSLARYVPLPLRLDDPESGPTFEPSPTTISALFSSRMVLEIVGPGGVGKTTLARQIGRWALQGDVPGGSHRHAMMPVWIDEDLDSGFDVLTKVIKEKLSAILPEEALDDEFLRAMLREQRILVIFDGLSERSAVTQKYVQRIYRSVRANAIVITTRTELNLEASETRFLYPQPLGEQYLTPFVMSLVETEPYPVVKDELARHLGDLFMTTVAGSDPAKIVPLTLYLFVEKAKQLIRAGRSLDELVMPKPEMGDSILEKPEYRDIEVIRVQRERDAEAQFQKNLKDTFVLRSFELRKVRFFENCMYEFAPRVNVLLGKNGYGKTLLFRALAALVQSDLENSAYLFPPSRESSIFAEGADVPTLTLRVDRNGDSAETIRDEVYFKKTAGKIPLLAIPDSRFMNRKVQTLAASTIATAELSSSGARNFLTQEPFEGVVVDLLVKLCQEFDRSGSLDRPIFRLIAEVVRELTDDDKFTFHSINHVGSSGYEILVTTSGSAGSPLPIQTASQGTLSVLVMAGLIFSFLKSLRPNVTDNAVFDVAAIVLIDEIDAHLHPCWQQKIMPILTKRFPNVQFIVSAHSPLLVAGCDRGEVAVLRRSPKSDRFYVETLEQDFLGAKVQDLYNLVFEAGDMDHLYLEYTAKGAAGGEARVAEQIERLESMPEWTTEQEAQLSALLRERRLLKRAAEVRATRLDAMGTEAQIEALQSEIKVLQEKLRKKSGTVGE